MADSISTTSSNQIQPQTHSIPLDIRKELPDHWTPWKISDATFAKMSTEQGKYKKAEVLPTDPEWRFVWRYFYHDKPKRWGIGRVYCIHERHQQQAFEFGLPSIEREADRFKPTWNEEPRSAQRAQAIERWKEATQIFSPFSTLESDGRRRDWKKTKILPLWHGTSKPVAQSISETGFVYFGKTSLGNTSNDPKSTDEGFFGSGIYFSNSARYVSDVYSSGHVLMAWVSMREPFPVVGDPDQKDMDTIKGKGAYKHYNAHYVPVTSIDPSSPYEAFYYPTQSGDTPHCDEIVVFHKSQTLPRFWIELTVESPTIISPSDVPQFVNEIIPHIFKILEHPGVDRDQKLRNHLNQELTFLLKLQGDDYLDDHGGKYEILYEHLTQLIVQGRVNRQVSRLITGSTPPAAPTSTTPAFVEEGQFISPKPKSIDIYKSLTSRLIAKHEDPIYGILELSDKDQFITASKDQKIKIWAKNGELIKEINAHSNWVVTLSMFSEKTFASGGRDSKIKVWDYNGNFVNELKGHTNCVFFLNYLSDNNLLSGSDDNTMRLWDKNGNTLTIFRGHEKTVRCAVEMRGGKIVSGSDDNTIKIWNKSGVCEKTITEHTGSVWAITKMNTDVFVSGSHDSKIKFWNMEGECLNTIEEAAKVWKLITMHEQEVLCVGLDDGTIKFINKLGNCISSYKEHRQIVFNLLETKDGSIISSSYDGTARLWKNADYKKIEQKPEQKPRDCIIS